MLLEEGTYCYGNGWIRNYGPCPGCVNCISQREYRDEYDTPIDPLKVVSNEELIRVLKNSLRLSKDTVCFPTSKEYTILEAFLEFCNRFERRS